MGKKKKKKYYDDEYDYSEINYNGDIRKAMKYMADSLERYLDYMETFIIFEGMTEDEWKANKSTVKSLIKKLRKGDPSVFDIPNLNETLRTNHELVVGIYD